MKRSELFLSALLVPVDFVMIVLAFFAAYWLRLNVGEVGFFWPFSQYLTFVLGLAPFWLPIFAVLGLYSMKKNRRAWEEFASIFVGVSGGTFLVIAWPFLTRQEFFSRLVVIYLFVLALVFVTFGRSLVRALKEYLYRFGIGTYRVVVVGTNEVAYQFIREIETNKALGMRLVGLLKVQDTDAVHPELSKYRILGLAKDFPSVARPDKYDSLLIAAPNVPKGTVTGLLEFAEENGLSFKLSPSLLEVHSFKIGISELAGVPILEYRRTPLEGWGMILKRIVDIVVSLLAIIITSPIMLLTALAIKLESKGPIFFSQLDDGSPLKRVGQYGRPFHYFKFRSMYPGTDSMRYNELSHLNLRKGTPLVKIKDDPRITRVGRIIRKLSIDELPEFFLVLTGKMSLVGPRPHLPEEVEKYQKHHRRVLLLKPGITGLAQISGRSDLDFEDEIRLDSYYIENWSLWLDIQTIIKTPFSVIFSRNRQAL